jgi:hypothetical protein
MRYYTRFFSLLSLACLVSLFSECSNPPAPKVDTFGELDSNKVAADTSMQVNMDRSYEYQRSLVQSDTVVFDFLAYDKPSAADGKKWESKFIVIRRTNTRQDTVIKDYRSGPVRGLSIADLDHDGSPEILFYEDQTAQKYSWIVRVYTRTATGKYHELRMTEFDAKTQTAHYHGRDTFFVYQDHLVRRYPNYKNTADSIPEGDWWQSYTISSGKILLQKETYAKD